MRTVDVARESGYSVQQVRDLERSGVLPPAGRADNGYRRYSYAHVQALRAYRGLAGAVGPVEARHLLARLRTGPVEAAAAAVGEIHVRLARERGEALRAQRALRVIQAEESGEDGDFMTITQLAEALGVRSSTLRFWEQEGLLHPERVTTLRARRYGPQAVAAARIVAALRSSGHGIPVVREIMRSLDSRDGLDVTGRILRERLDRIAARSVALLRAGTDLAAVVDATRETPGPPE
jgi:DNA-binding transcriptional MerR regulator